MGSESLVHVGKGELDILAVGFTQKQPCAYYPTNGELCDCALITSWISPYGSISELRVVGGGDGRRGGANATSEIHPTMNESSRGVGF
jgi:hypothetical protein